MWSPRRHFLSLEEKDQSRTLTELAAALGCEPLEALSRLEGVDEPGVWEGWWARPNQCEPSTPEWAVPGKQWVWLILAGRGFGKTRTGAEFCKKKALEHPGCHIALVARTTGDARDVMVEGEESGLLEILPRSILRGGSAQTAWNRSLGELHLANGSRFSTYSSEKPDSLRGPQHHFAWADELCSWDDAQLGNVLNTTWNNLTLTLRLGRDPKVVVTTTPKPVKLLIGEPGVVGLQDQGGVLITRGSTYDNIENLAPPMRENILALYEGTRIGRQELYAEVLTSVPGALWTTDLLDKCRRPAPKQWRRIVIGVDPSVATGEGEGHAETGIVVCGIGDEDSEAYVIADKSIRGSPEAWASAVQRAYQMYEANIVVAEKNNGGEMVRTTLRMAAPWLPVKLVSASQGKVARAEPVCALYEQGRIHHVQPFVDLEHQMCTFQTGSKTSPDRLDALVWALTELCVQPRGGAQTVYRPGAHTEPIIRRGGLTLVGRHHIDERRET